MTKRGVFISRVVGFMVVAALYAYLFTQAEHFNNPQGWLVLTLIGAIISIAWIQFLSATEPKKEGDQ
jgi:predicted membrane protein